MRQKSFPFQRVGTQRLQHTISAKYCQAKICYFLPHFAAEYKAPGALSRPRIVACQKSVFDKLSNETRFTGLSFEKAAARCIARRARLRRTLRTFASRAVFSPTYTPPEKMIPTFFALASANSARLFRQPEACSNRGTGFSYSRS